MLKYKVYRIFTMKNIWCTISLNVKIKNRKEYTITTKINENRFDFDISYQTALMLQFLAFEIIDYMIAKVTDQLDYRELRKHATCYVDSSD